MEYFDYNRRFILSTDASQVGSGVTSAQDDDADIQRIVAYDGHKFKGPQVNWSIPEKELFAFVHAVKVLQPYLYGAHFL